MNPEWRCIPNCGISIAPLHPDLMVQKFVLRIYDGEKDHAVKALIVIVG